MKSLKEILALSARLAMAAVVLAALSSPAATLPTQSDPSESVAVATLRGVLAQAGREGPYAQSLQARATARSHALRLEAGLSAPRLELQSEGFGSSFDREPHAIDYLRWSQPFRWPGSGSDALRDAVDEWHRVTGRALQLESMATAGDLWLELLAESTTLQVLEGRIERLERALRVYELRFELGEVAGSEVRQLELQLETDRSDLEASRVRRIELRSRLAVLLGTEPPRTDGGDLEALLAWTGPQRSTGAAPAGPLAERVTANVEVTAQRSRLARRTAAGEPTFDAQWERIPTLDGIDAYDALGLQLSVPLPLGGATRQRKAQARAEETVAQLEGELDLRRLEQRLETSRAREAAARRLLDQLEAAFLELPSTEDSLNEQFRLGAISYLVFLDGFTRIDDLRLRRILAQRSLLAARLEQALLLDDATLFPLPPRPPSPQAPSVSEPEGAP